jgi:hypothetical protein
MRTYYRGRDAHVTEEHFVWFTSPPKTFRIRELHDVVLVRGRPKVISRPGSRLAGGGIVLLAAGWPLAVAPGAVTATLIVLAGAGVAAAAYRIRRPQHWELHAHYRGRPVVIFSGGNLQAFNQITRGLRRALESSGPRRGYELAS